MELRVLSAGAAKGLLQGVEPSFCSTAGVKIQFLFGAVGAVKQKYLAGEPCDVIVLTAALIDELERQGRVDAGYIRPLGKVRTGFAVRVGEPLPDISDNASLRRSLLAAREIHYGDPQTATASAHFIAVLKRLGIHGEVEPRLRSHVNGTVALHELAHSAGPGLLGCSQITEIKAINGLALVGPFRHEHDLATTYAAAVCSTTQNPQLARKLVTMISGPDAAHMRAALGFEL